MKVCKVCLIEKNYNQFYKDKSRSSGLARECKECCNDRKKKFREANREYINEQCRKNSHKYKERKSERAHERYLEIKDEYLAKQRDFYHANKERIAKRRSEQRRTPEFREKDRIRQRKWQKENKEKILNYVKKWIENNRQKKRAHYAISDAIRRGKMIRKTECEKCGSKDKIDAHHSDYSQPLNVLWLCRLCHKGEHHVQSYI